MKSYEKKNDNNNNNIRYRKEGNYCLQCSFDQS